MRGKRRMRGAWLAIVLLGCVGEQVKTTNADAGGSTDAATTMCNPVAGNLLKNPSFEDWDGTVARNWPHEYVVPPRKKTGGAADCSTWIELDYFTCYDPSARPSRSTLPCPRAR